MLPPGACDCHVHVIGPTSQYPMVADRHYTPGLATVGALRAHMANNGLSRAVIVQPSVYGTDNTCLLDSLHELGGAGRGVAVVEPGVSDEALRTLSAHGIRGLRINVESAGAQDPKALGSAMAYWAERLAPLNWHLQIYASLDTLASAAPYLGELSVPVVLDHFAMVPASIPDTDARMEAVLGLIRAGRAYVKLSAPYRLQSPDHQVSGAVARLVARYLRANPNRVLWGSDWPHTNREDGKLAHQVSAYRAIEPSLLARGIAAWLPTGSLRQQVLVDNPSALYGFTPG